MKNPGFTGLCFPEHAPLAWKRMFVLFLIFILPGISSAREYYVSSSGSNYNTGTITSPFRTISFAMTKIGEGDIITVRTGKYREQVNTWGKTTTSGKPIIIRSYPGENPVIDGTGIDAGQGGGIVMIWQSHVTFTGFTVINSSRSGIVCGTKADHCIISDCIVSDIHDTGIGYYGNSGLIERCTVSNACMSNNDGIYTPPEVWGAGINIRNQTTARNNIIHDVWGEGLSVTIADNSVVAGNIIYDIASVHLYVMNCRNCKIMKNLVFMTKKMGNISSVGLGMWNELNDNQNSGNIVINNIVYKCRRNFYSEGSMVSTIVANNTFVNSTDLWDVQISGDKLSNGRFINNILLQDDQLPCIFVSEGSGVTFSNNLFNKSYSNAARGKDDITGDPLLEKSGNQGSEITSAFFRLTSSSPAIDKALSMAEVSDDIFGNKRSSMPDIGAHEFFELPPDIKVTSVRIIFTGEEATVITGEKLILTVEVLPGNASNTSVSWSVSNSTGSASISSSGILTGLTAGTVTVNVSTLDGSGITASIPVNVVPPLSEISHMYIYPNPAVDHFYFSVPRTPDTSLLLLISDISGRIIQKNTIESSSKDVLLKVSLITGIYIVTLLAGKEIIEVQKLIIER